MAITLTALLALFGPNCPAQSATVLADSVSEFSGVQGFAGWEYGFWNRSADPDGQYQPDDFAQLGIWTGSSWRYSLTAPPWTVIASELAHPDDSTPGPELQAIRRWTSDHEGLVRIRGNISKFSSAGSGVIGHVLVDGVPFAASLLGGGIAASHDYDFVARCHVGTRIDLVLDAWGNDGADLTRFTATMESEPALVASSTTDFSGTQGHLGWRYGYYDGDSPSPYGAADFEEFDGFDAAGQSWYVSSGSGFVWTMVSRSGAHPNGIVTSGGAVPVEHWAVRRWNSTVAGRVQIVGHCRKSYINGGNGVQAFAVVDGVVAWSSFIGANGGAGVDFQVVANLTQSSVVDFVIAPNSSNDISDGTMFTVEIRADEPALTYCSGKTNSLGCVPNVVFAGTPSLSSNLPFTITSTQQLNNKIGLLLYGLDQISSPFQGGLLCVRSPVRRTSPQGTGGSPIGNDCSGVLDLDFNSRIQSSQDPALSVEGQEVFVQFWSRDPGSASTTSLSNALRFVIGP